MQGTMNEMCDDKTSREQGAGSREQGAGSREQGAGSREQGAGSREQGGGNDVLIVIEGDTARLGVGMDIPEQASLIQTNYVKAACSRFRLR
eukprot:762631-Hanusia_phi.AAC.2